MLSAGCLHRWLEAMSAAAATRRAIIFGAPRIGPIASRPSPRAASGASLSDRVDSSRTCNPRQNVSKTGGRGKGLNRPTGWLRFSCSVKASQGHRPLTPLGSCMQFAVFSDASRADGEEPYVSGRIEMKPLAVAELSFLTAVSCAAYSQTIPAGRAQLIISVDLGDLPQGPLFWHLYNYPSRAAAEIEAEKAPTATVVEAFTQQSVI